MDISKYGPAAKKYLAVTTLFLVLMGIKVLYDRPYWTSEGWTHWLLSTIIIIPVIWYAGYFWRQAGEYQYRQLLTEKSKPS